MPFTVAEARGDLDALMYCRAGHLFALRDADRDRHGTWCPECGNSAHTAPAGDGSHVALADTPDGPLPFAFEADPERPLLGGPRHHVIARPLFGDEDVIPVAFVDRGERGAFDAGERHHNPWSFLNTVMPEGD